MNERSSNKYFYFFTFFLPKNVNENISQCSPGNYTHLSVGNHWLATNMGENHLEHSVRKHYLYGLSNKGHFVYFIIVCKIYDVHPL
jgi:hypothetical protein